ncbi:hypothetical protein WS62_23320 [Burkholderia sp. ABCPW 14]|nr:hypothetical protein WS62_23320 [Burkholderia sp. ABCPW 14]
MWGTGPNTLAPQSMGFLQEFDGGFKFDDVACAKSDKELVIQLATSLISQAPRCSRGYSQKLQGLTCHGIDVQRHPRDAHFRT